MRNQYGRYRPKSLKIEGQGALYPSWLLATPLKLLIQQGQPQYLGTLQLLDRPGRGAVPCEAWYLLGLFA